MFATASKHKTYIIVLTLDAHIPYMTRLALAPLILVVSCITLEPYGVRVNVVGEAYEIIYEALYAIVDTLSLIHI